MTQHLILRDPTGRPKLTGSDGRMLTACGRRVTSANASGPAGVTCRACKGTEAWDKALYGVVR